MKFENFGCKNKVLVIKLILDDGITFASFIGLIFYLKSAKISSEGTTQQKYSFLLTVYIYKFFRGYFYTRTKYKCILGSIKISKYEKTTLPPFKSPLEKT